MKSDMQKGGGGEGLESSFNDFHKKEIEKDPDGALTEEELKVFSELLKAHLE